MSLNDIIAIVRTDEARQLKDAIVFTILIVTLAIPFAVILYRKFKRVGACFGLIACGFITAIATKPSVLTPEIVWDTGLYNNWSHFDTNNYATIHFRWTKDDSVKSAEPVYFAARHKGYPELEYDEIGQSTAGLEEWDYTFSGGEIATNYQYYVFMLGEVHTNGVWLGNILQKTTPGSGGPDKMVIIKSKLEVNGKEIAPFKEEE